MSSARMTRPASWRTIVWAARRPVMEFRSTTCISRPTFHQPLFGIDHSFPVISLERWQAQSGDRSRLGSPSPLKKNNGSSRGSTDTWVIRRRQPHQKDVEADGQRPRESQSSVGVTVTEFSPGAGWNCMTIQIWSVVPLLRSHRRSSVLADVATRSALVVPRLTCSGIANICERSRSVTRPRRFIHKEVASGNHTSLLDLQHREGV